MSFEFPKRLICICLCIFCLSGVLTAPKVYAGGSISVQQARSLALKESSEIKKQYNKIVLQRMKYMDAVKSIQEKIRNLTTFRWTPLFGFHFPEKLNMTEDYESTIKPLVLETEISVMSHELEDLRYTVLNEVNQTFISVYESQEKVAFTEKRLAGAEDDLNRNKSKLLSGSATQNDIDTMEKTVTTLTGDLSIQKKNFEIAKKELTDLIKLNVTTGYTFQNPLVTVNITRNHLEEFTNYTVENDQGLFEAKTAKVIADLNLTSYESLMKKQYGSKMNSITPFINMARQGMDLDYSAFQIKYKEFLTAIDKPWKGRFWIIFIPIPKEWTKGGIDGVRYIEDEVYAAYTASMEYASAMRDEATTEKNLRKEVNTGYETIVSAYNAYNAINEQLLSIKTDLNKMAELNKLGKVEYAELKDKQDDYQELQLEAIDALSSYNQLLFEFDRLTCGSLVKYMKGENLSMDAQSGGDSFADYDNVSKPYYYIYTEIDKMLFVLGLNIPENYVPEITNYEVWYENTQIGSRMDISQQLRHLALDYGETSKLKIRLFDGDKFLDECEVDTNVPRAELKLKGKVTESAPTEMQIGKYNITAVSYDDFQMSVLTLEANPGLGVAYYSLSVPAGAKIFSDALIPISDEFSYLTALMSSLDIVECTFYDKNSNEIYKARFDTKTKSIMTKI